MKESMSVTIPPRNGSRPMRGMGIRWISLIVGMALFAAAGCGSKETTDELAPDPDSRISPGGDPIKVQGLVEWVEPTEVQEWIGLRAIAKGDVVAVYIRNGGQSDFLLSPTDFGVIAGGKLHRVQLGKGGFRENRFPSPFRMQPGTTTAGMLVFPEAGDLTGGRLVFNNPEIGKPFYVPIEMGGETAPGAKP